MFDTEFITPYCYFYPSRMDIFIADRRLPFCGSVYHVCEILKQIHFLYSYATRNRHQTGLRPICRTTCLVRGKEFPHYGGTYSPCLWGKIPIGMGKVGKCIFSTPFFRNRAIYSRLDSQELILPKLVWCSWQTSPFFHPSLFLHCNYLLYNML